MGFETDPQTETRCECLDGGFRAPYNKDLFGKKLRAFMGEYGKEYITVWIPRDSVDINKYPFAKFWDVTDTIAIQVRYQDIWAGRWVNFAYIMEAPGVKVG